MIDAQFHHSAFTISKGASTLIHDFCLFMGAQLDWENAAECADKEIMMRFNQHHLVQFIETDATSIEADKEDIHLAFSTNTPNQTLTAIANWFREHKIDVRTGAWSETELWLDCPSIFVNFAIEVFQL